jgi:hypothetical protein
LAPLQVQAITCTRYLGQKFGCWLSRRTSLAPPRSLHQPTAPPLTPQSTNPRHIHTSPSRPLLSHLSSDLSTTDQAAAATPIRPSPQARLLSGIVNDRQIFTTSPRRHSPFSGLSSACHLEPLSMSPSTFASAAASGNNANSPRADTNEWYVMRCYYYCTYAEHCCRIDFMFIM